MKRIIFILAFLSSSFLFAKDPSLSCEKKWGEIRWEGLIVKRYRLRAEDFPPGEKFRLIVKNFDEVETETFLYEANQKGHLILQPIENVEGSLYAICPAKKGEKLTFLMCSEDQQCQCAAECIPFPLEMKSKKGVLLSLELMGEKGEKFLLRGEGFQPNEALTVYCESLELKAVASPIGTLETLLSLPSSVNGNVTLYVQRQVEEISFPFQAGDSALQIIGACCLEIR